MIVTKVFLKSVKSICTMKDSSYLVEQEIPRGCRICRCYCIVANLGGKTYNAQFAPEKGAWGNFCVSELSLERVKALVPERCFEVVSVAVFVNTKTDQAFSLKCLANALVEGKLAFPMHYVTELVLNMTNPRSSFRWEPGTPEPAAPFAARAVSEAFTVKAGTRGA